MWRRGADVVRKKGIGKPVRAFLCLFSFAAAKARAAKRQSFRRHRYAHCIACDKVFLWCCPRPRSQKTERSEVSLCLLYRRGQIFLGGVVPLSHRPRESPIPPRKSAPPSIVMPPSGETGRCLTYGSADRGEGAAFEDRPSYSKRFLQVRFLISTVSSFRALRYTTAKC